MFDRFTLLAALVGAFATTAACASEPVPMDWSQLLDQSRQTFEDPYRDLSPENLDALITLVRLENRLDSGTVAEEARPRLEARSAKTRGALEADGIDVDWLIAQRWIVAERRREAAVAVNAEMDGASIEIGGFLVPAPSLADGRSVGYLVPERGMCAHMPPPPPNQMLRVVMDAGGDEIRLFEPVVVTGVLVADETRFDTFVVDGSIPMWSSWRLDSSEVRFLTPKGSANKTESDQSTSSSVRARWHALGSPKAPQTDGDATGTN